MNVKNLTLVAVTSALQIAMSILLPIISLLTLIVVGLTLKLKQALFMAFVTGVVTTIVSSKPIAAINIAVLPLIVLCLKFWQAKRMESCSREKKIQLHIELGLLSFVLILIGNIVGEIIYGVSIGALEKYLIASLPVAIISALINAIVIGVVAIPIHYRVCKLYLKHGF